MYDFQLFIDDDRYSVVSMRFLTAGDAEQACDLAEQALAESPHHLGAELYFGEHWLWSKGSLLRKVQIHRRG